MSTQITISQPNAHQIEKEVYKLISNVLLIPIENIHPELDYQSNMQWDSMGHINLMLALEKEFEVKIDQDKVLELTSVQEIVSYIIDCNHLQDANRKNLEKSKENLSPIARGLNNVYFDESKITDIDAQNGKLFYRGYSIENLVSGASYEEVAYLLIYGDLPSQKFLEKFKEKIYLYRPLSDTLINLLKVLSLHHSAVDVLRTAVSALEPTLERLSIEDKAIAYIAKIPTIIGAYLSIKKSEELQIPAYNLSQSDYLLFMITGKIFDKEISRIFEKNMILQAEHGSNASTFAARVTISTDASMGNAITSAIATFSGGLHGGALLGVVQMLEEIKEINNVKNYIHTRLQKKLPIYGFGHRVYRTEDPRAKILKRNADFLVEKLGNNALLEMLEAIKLEMAGYIEHGININVDFYACVSYLLMDIPKEMLVPTFIASRSCGWISHILEQKNNNILIRPRLKYIGEKEKNFVSFCERVGDKEIC